MPEETPDNKQINDLLQKQKMTFGELVEKWRGRKRAQEGHVRGPRLLAVPVRGRGRCHGLEQVQPIDHSHVQ
jgi:hypothetical protein